MGFLANTQAFRLGLIPDNILRRPGFVVRLHVRSIDQLDHILDRIADKAQTSTAIVKSQPIKRRPPGIGQRKATPGRV
jgi:hypothetical protein